MLVTSLLDLNKNELRNAKVYPLASGSVTTLASGLGAGDKGMAVYDTTNNRVGFWNGASFDYPQTGTGVTSLGATSPVQVSGSTGAVTISMLAASGSQNGYMSSADYTTLHAATSAATASTLVQRDASGNFSAGTITAALTGTASNASNLTPGADINFGGFKATNLGTPVGGTDAATKAYVDATAQGMTPKGMARAVATANVASLSGTTTIDGVALVAGDVVLLTAQTTGANNGPWTIAAGAWTRPANFSSSAQVGPGDYWFISEGTQYGNTGWWVTTDNPITLGTTSLTIQEFAGPGSMLAGNGLSMSGNTISAVGTANRISVSGAGIDIAATYVGQTSITTLGTISAGTWQGTAVGVAYGGTGATTAAGARTNLGATTKVTGTVTGNGSATSFTLTHNLGTVDHAVQVFDASQNLILIDVQRGVNSDTLTFGAAPAAVNYNWIVVG